jgi:hypothetical protein
MLALQSCERVIVRAWPPNVRRRKRLVWSPEPAYDTRCSAGVAWIGTVELTALSVYTSPGWAPIAQRLLSGH